MATPKKKTRLSSVAKSVAKSKKAKAKTKKAVKLPAFATVIVNSLKATRALAA